MGLLKNSLLLQGQLRRAAAAAAAAGMGRRGVAMATATEEYMRRNYANNVSEYNTVIGSLVQQRRPYLLRDAYDDMILDGVQPVRDTFHNLIVGAGQLRHAAAAGVGRRGVATATATATEEYMRRNYANNVVRDMTAAGLGLNKSAKVQAPVPARRSEMPMRRHYAALLRHAAALPSLPLVASLHAAALRRGAVLVPSLIHAYSACGDPASARSLFDGLPAQDQTLSARTALASAMSAHGGRCQEILELFRSREGEMDDKAVTVVLAACARAGMVDEGRRVFARVRRPALQHYTCMVEMLGRAGDVEEAEGLVTRMEARPDRVICAVLLAACRVHGRVDVAERVARLMRGYGIA